MASISDYLASEHRHCDALFVAAEGAVARGAWDAATRDFQAFREDTECHLAREEQVLFPAFEAHTGTDMGPTRIMRMEHAQMRALFDDMAAALAARQPDHYLGLSETLLILMQQHNMKEEQILYPMVDRVLPGADALIARMRDVGSCAGVVQKSAP